MSDEGPAPNNWSLSDYLNRGWTIATYKEHMGEVLSLRDRIYEQKDKLEAERDRRYSEVNTEREKALKIKEEADKAALGLAREIQTYKDEKANELREQINRERSLYASRDDLQAAMREIDATLKPLIGTRREGSQITMSGLVVAVTIALAAGGLMVNFLHSSSSVPPALIPGQSGTQTTPIPPPPGRF